MSNGDMGIGPQGGPRVLEKAFTSLEQKAQGNLFSRIFKALKDGLSKVVHSLSTSRPLLSRTAQGVEAPQRGRVANALVPNTLTREQAQLYSYPSTKDGFTIDHVHAVYLKLTAGSGMPLKDRNEGAANSLRQSIFNSIEKAGAETEPMGIVESAVKKFIADRNLVAEKMPASEPRRECISNGFGRGKRSS